MNRMSIVFATAVALLALPVSPLLSVVACGCMLFGWWSMEQDDIAAALGTGEAVRRSRLAIDSTAG